MAKKASGRPKFKAGDSNDNSGAIIDVPHLDIFKQLPPDRLLERFQEEWRLESSEIAGVALPVAHRDGLNFPVEGLDAPVSPAGGIRGIRTFSELVRAIGKQRESLQVYLTLEMPCPCLANNELLQIVDLVGDPSRALCWANPMNHDMLGAILATADYDVREALERDDAVGAVVLDLVDILPMGGNETTGVEPTCFCRTCAAYIDSRSPGLVAKLKKHPSPFNLLLRATDTGISHVSDIRADWDEQRVIDACKTKGFNKAGPLDGMSESDLKSMARVLLEYLNVRHVQLFEAIGSIRDAMLRYGESRTELNLLCSGSAYDWTSGMMLEKFDLPREKRSYGELWFDLQTSTPNLEHVPYRAYMTRRSRYFVDALFAGLDLASRESGLPAEFLLRPMIEQRSRQLLGSLISGTAALAALPPLATGKSAGGRRGFVAPAVWPAVVERLLEELRLPRGDRRDGAQIRTVEDLLRRLGSGGQGS